MFQLHERTRLLLCRAGFLFLCVVPTLLLCGAAVHYRSSAYLEARRDEWVAVLSDKLGLDVKIANLSYPHWNTALLEGLVLLDAESGEEVVRTRYVEVTWQEGRWQIVAGQPEVVAGSLPLLVELVNYRLLRGQALQLAPVQFEARELTFHSAAAAQTFQNVHAELATADAGKHIHVNFQFAGLESKTPLQLSIKRQRSSGSAVTTCQLNTGETQLPCAALVPLESWLKQLGDDATFQGQASLEQSNEGIATELNGDFHHVDLDRLVSLRFPHHRLSGQADVRLQRLKLHSGRIVAMEGQLQTHGGGVVSRSLLMAVQKQLDLKPQDQQLDLAIGPSSLRYSHLAFGFALDAAGLSISGDDNPANPGVIMASAALGPLLSESAETVVPVAYFMRAVLPHSDVQIPATAEAKSLFDLLPLPALLPPNNAALPNAPIIRLRTSK